MNLVRSIPKSPKLKPGEDFAFLRQQGIQLIQQLSGLRWSDHNLHDPGITLLEAFCYVLTELSLKANLNIKDILASGHPNLEQALFTPEVAMTVHPTTVRDYRKILIDTEGVRNGWMMLSNVSDAQNVNGLYEVLLELEDHPILGDINSGIIQRSFNIDYGGGDIREYDVEISFPYWDEEPVAAFREEVIIAGIISPGEATVVMNTIATPDDHDDYFAELEVSHDGLSPTTFGVTIRVTPPIGADAVENAAVEAEISSLLSEAPGGGPADQSILTTYNRKVVAAAAIEMEVFAKLMAQRNLCEDMLNIKAVRIQEIGLDVQIELLQSFNLEKYLAQLLYSLELFFKPDIRFSTLAELLRQEVPMEQIFEGPLLTSGFISDTLLDDLPRATDDDRNSRIYVSDLVNLLIRIATQNAARPTSVIEGQVIAISSISISNFIRNKIVVSKATDCLVLAKPELFKPRFSLNKSNIRFFRNGLPVPYNAGLVQTLYEALKTAASLNLSSTVATTPPQGETLPISSFYSIQHDFPAIYGLGRNVLSESYPAEQRAKVEQFRAYLVLIDQLLGSFTGQLSNINELFSIDPQATKTYFKQALYEIPYLERLLVSFLGSPLNWQDFQADANNAYQQALTNIYETTEVFLDRRNRFLDHLLARFGLSLKRFIAWRNEEESLNITESTELQLREQEIAYDLILDKINVLRLFPLLSSSRFAAFDYTGTPWDTPNISGLSRRLLTFLGFRNLNRRTFHSEAINFIAVNEPVPGNFNFEILDGAGDVILESVDPFPTAAAAEAAAFELIRQGIHRNNFHIAPQVSGGIVEYMVGFQPDTPALPVFTAVLPTLQAREFDARTSIRRLMREIGAIGSGLYLVEHILLYPEAAEPEALEIQAAEPGTFLPDPYSMRVSIIFPSGFDRDFSDPNAAAAPGIPAQFQDQKCRNYAMELVRQETPAHIIPHVFWLDRNTAADISDTPSINNFSARWQAWLEAKAISAADLATRRAAFIAVLNAVFAAESS